MPEQRDQGGTRQPQQGQQGQQNRQPQQGQQGQQNRQPQQDKGGKSQQGKMNQGQNLNQNRDQRR